MKKVVAVFLTAMIGGACLCGNAVSARGTAYAEDGIMPLSTASEQVYYADRQEDECRMVLKHPEYESCAYAASCACVAGANVIGYFDRYYENLIPDHSAGYDFRGDFIYASEDSAVFQTTNQLYQDMGTNADGTTVEEFKKGMKTYCARKGLNITFASCMTNGKFNLDEAKRRMEKDWPVVFFCGGYNIAEIYEYEGYDNIAYIESDANHVIVGFGYLDIYYTMSDSTNDLYRFIKTATGNLINTNGYYNIDYKTKINDAYAINIY